MPEFLLELFSEEIPARMQSRGAEDLARAVSAALAPVLEGAPRPFHGPRRIGLVATLRAEVTTPGKEERGPRTGAPDAALAGFLKKHGAAREALVERGGFWVLDKPGETVSARDLAARALPGVIRGLSWPKSMRWGTSDLAWVRPLQRILCLLDGEVVRFDLRQRDGDGEDAAHGLAAADLTEGHRVMAPGAFAVRGFADYEAGLRERRVILDAAERVRVIEEGLAALAARHGVAVVPDRGLLEEVAGLVEWPVPLAGRIDDAFMDLPPELMRTTMRVNQRYFAMTKPDGSAAPVFGVVANIAASDGGAALVAGNERVLRARLSDARSLLGHGPASRRWRSSCRSSTAWCSTRSSARRGSAWRGWSGWRGTSRRVVGADPDLAARDGAVANGRPRLRHGRRVPRAAGRDGPLHAQAGGEDPRVAEAIGMQYRPLGPTDAVPSEPVAVAVALADKLDTLAGFFAADERPTGSGDPFALRRARSA
jgi:glycyl-tRNA synthetase beta chain